jgi:large subunit ribosomal protein L20
MPRARLGSARHRKKVRLFRAAQGYAGPRSKLLRPAKETLTKAGVYAYRDRRAKKREFRALWITRLTAACRARGISYSRFVSGLKAANIIINRKMLSQLAIEEPKAFDAVAEIAKTHAAKSAA